jgi:predicted nucleic acid-binding protein
MAAALVDTNVLVAVSHVRDQYHEPARRIVTGIDHGRLPEVRVTDYVLAETLKLVGERIDPDTAVDLLDTLTESGGFDIVHLTRTDFNAGRALFRTHAPLSLVDAVTVAYMQREGVEYLYSFDDDFDAVVDVARLATAENPFE